MIGHLNHVGYIIPTARHFLRRIRKLKTTSRFRRQINIPGQVLADIELWISFVKQSNKGISMNILTDG